PLQLGTAVLANGAQRGCGDDAPTIAHDFDEQRLTGWLLIVSDDAIAQVLARGCALAKHLTHSRPRSLAGRAFAPRPAVVFLQLVDHIERGGIGGHSERGAHTE